MERFTPAELRQLRSLRSPAGVQRFLDDLPYHHADTVWSPRRVLLQRTAHCLEAAIFAAAALRVSGLFPITCARSRIFLCCGRPRSAPSSASTIVRTRRACWATPGTHELALRIFPAR